MVDGARRLGNHQCLPAGPLREPVSRLLKADFIVITNGHGNDPYRSILEPADLVQVRTRDQLVHVSTLVGKTVHAVAGIGYPERFFDTLRSMGMDVIEHPFDDHHVFTKEDLVFDSEYPIVMTEKDAVKCCTLVGDDAFYITIDAVLNDEFFEALEKRI